MINDVMQAFRETREYVDLLAKPSFEALGKLFGDKVQFWRVKNQINILQKTREFLEQKGIDPRNIAAPPEVIIPLLEEGGDKSDETLSDMFARLLAS